MIALLLAAGLELSPFRATDYPAPRFRVRQRDVRLGAATLRMTHVWSAGGQDFMCRAWLDLLRRPGHAAIHLWNGTTDPVGTAAGLYIPARQPSDRFLMIVKAGDYEGLFLFVHPDGSLTITEGGDFVIDRQHELLFGLTYSDSAEVIVVDLRTLRQVGEDIPAAPERFYRAGSRFFVTGTDTAGPHAFEFDFGRRSFLPVKDARDRWTPVPWDFELSSRSICGGTFR